MITVYIAAPRSRGFKIPLFLNLNSLFETVEILFVRSKKYHGKNQKKENFNRYFDKIVRMDNSVGQVDQKGKY